MRLMCTVRSRCSSLKVILGGAISMVVKGPSKRGVILLFPSLHVQIRSMLKSFC